MMNLRDAVKLVVADIQKQSRNALTVTQALTITVRDVSDADIARLPDRDLREAYMLVHASTDAQIAAALRGN